MKVKVMTKSKKAYIARTQGAKSGTALKDEQSPSQKQVRGPRDLTN